MDDRQSYILRSEPMRFGRLCWPDMDLYREQQAIVHSVRDDDETYCVAGNQLGKDYVAGFIAVWFFLTRGPCRIITTSAKDDHLRVLWGEINRFLTTSKVPLLYPHGPVVAQHQLLKKVVNGEVCPISYAKGMVASQESIASLGGHHAGNFGDGVPRTLAIFDEASSVSDEYIKVIRPWAKRILVIGNAWPCENFFKQAVKGKPGTEDKGGDIPREPRRGPQDPSTGGLEGTNAGVERPAGYHRRVLRIRATDSPNVRLAFAERDQGLEPSGRLVLQGVKDWAEYQKNLKTWDKHQQTVSLEADFYEGVEIKLFPQEWLARAADPALRELCQRYPTEAIGIDVGEGVANTSMAAVNRYGVKEIVSEKTPDTSVIPGRVIAFGTRHKVDPHNWVFDNGGGGKQHADRLRSMGHKVRGISFGETVQIRPRHGINTVQMRTDVKEDQTAYRNRRAEMYGELSILIDPGQGPASFRKDWPTAFSLPLMSTETIELHRQLAPIPKIYVEGKLELPAKNRRPESDSKQKTLVELLGCSPDEADAVVLGCHGMLHKGIRSQAGAVA